ncbi:alpha/beta fold hydrolase [Gryllotalpicola reticulitermitis]|uniref:Alpha/beta fold hydrolase n=1 Tax=Gryllotalpicola reticulitermitis TaxID=1184153 RepID=A0ABV8Q9A0_9MICO
MPSTVPTRLGRLGVTVQEGPKPVAVLWHSFFVDSHSWVRVARALTRLRTLVLIDGPSFGASEPLRRRATIEECAQAAFEVLDSLGIRRADWVGNGWGGQVGIAAAVQQPRRIRSLVAIGAPTSPIAGRERRDLAAALPLVRLFGFRGPIERGVLRSVLTPRTIAIDPEAVRIVRDGFINTDRRGFVHAARSFVLERPSLDKAALAVEAPTVFVAGDSRSGWGPREAQAVTDRMTDARTRTLHGVRNIAPLEDADAVAGMVREHWAATSRR